ncbi:MAG TPA: 2,3-bisphosphoglycerate-independent phosphoglycerate mutase [Methanothrix sp.]|nr:2,3-bisphosphoglycerate-independent phosphoglycerate mutase [Methanothrix sp.]HRW82820.1 2,3-bisphosphoglycerate-independent phosphoglycerate mutase [Methanothrix sp.]
MKPVTLIIMDGFGESDEIEGNAIASAKTPNIDRLKSSYPFTTIGAAGLDVGLPPGQMGNSEVGHLNLGAGRVVYQDYTRINLAIEDGSFYSNPVLVEAADLAKERGRTLHLMGLLSDGGVHSHNAHLYALLRLAKARGVERLRIHAILDGRDVPPRSALGYFRDLGDEVATIGLGSVATVAGRYYSMDRDRRWERTKLAYRAMTSGEGLRAESPEEAVKAGYDRGEDDEFLKPTVIDPDGLVRDGDSLIFFNFRPDRARQITKAFVDPDFCDFERDKIDVHFVCMTLYQESIRSPVAFPADHLKETLGEVVSGSGLRQLRIAETEKYAHVTFFFNGGREEASPGEDRLLIPSPKVATYDRKPEMSAFEVTDAVVEKIKEGVYDLIVLNYANSDMVGHTGIFDAAVKAVEAVDECVGRVVSEVLARGGAVLLTADHGNAEQMENEATGQHHTAHTTNPVPFVLIRDGEKARLREDGILADVAPTVLDLLGLPVPAAMTGRSLIVRD